MSRNEAPITLIGNLAIDVHTYVDDNQWPSAATEKFHAQVGIGPGGSILNAAKTFAALGRRSELVALVGKDDEGQLIIENLNQSGFSTRLVRPILPQTYKTVLVVDGDGDKKMFSSSTSLPSREAIRKALLSDIGRPDHVHISAKPWTIELAIDLDDSVPLSVDLHSGVDVSPYPELLQRGPIVFFSVVGIDDAEAAARDYVAGGARVAICTQGPRGALVAQRGSPEVGLYPAVVPRDRVVDTVGAGDVFAATFLHYLYRGDPPPQCVRKAHLQASKSCTTYGMHELYSEQEVDEAAGG